MQEEEIWKDINGIKQDNRVENLEWCDNSTNQRHAYANGLNPHHIGRKRKVLITTVSGDSLVFQTIREAAKHIGVNEETVRNRIKKPIQSSNQHKFVPFLTKDIQ